MSLNRRVTFFISTLAFVATIPAQHASAQAQDLSPSPTAASAVNATAERTMNAALSPVDAPRADAATVGVRRIEPAAAPEFAFRQDREPRPVALMIVGGATMLVGTVIDDDAGTIVTIGGAAIFLIGVWRYLNLSR